MANHPNRSKRTRRAFYIGWTQNPYGPKIHTQDLSEAVDWAERVVRLSEAQGYSFIADQRTQGFAMFSGYKSAWTDDAGLLARLDVGV